MNPDGTGQTELRCNNSWFPTTILPPYYKGAWSKLITILEQGHEEVEMSQEKVVKYDHFMKKRERMGEIERKNIEELITAVAEL